MKTIYEDCEENVEEIKKSCRGNDIIFEIRKGNKQKIIQII